MADSVYNLMIKVQADGAAMAPLETGLRKVAAAEDAVHVSQGRAGSSAVNLVRQINDVGVMAAMGANPLQILAMQGEQIAFAFREAGGAAGLYAVAQKAVAASSVAFLAVAGPLTVALAAVGAAYYLASKDAERLEKANAKAASAATDAQKRHESLADLEASTQRSWAVATGQTTEKYQELDDRLKKVRETFDSAIQEEVKAMQAGAGSAAQHRQAIDNLTERKTALLRMTREEVKAEIAAEEARKRGTHAIKDQTAANRLAEQALTFMDRANKIASGSMSEEAQATEEARLQIEKLRREAEALGISADKIQPAIDALNKKLRSTLVDIEIRKVGEAFDNLPVVIDPAAAALGDFNKAIEDIAPPKAIDALERLALIQADLAIAMSAGAITADQYAEAMDRVTKASVEASAVRSTGSATAVVNTVGGGANGMLNALGNAGPYGGLIASILSLIENLDKTLDGITDFLSNFTEQLANLPETVGNFVGDLLTDILPGIIDAVGELLRGLPDLIGSLLGSISEMIPDLLGSILDLLFSAIPDLIINLIAGIFDGDMWESAGKSLVKGFTDNFSVKKGEEGKAVANVLTLGIYGAIDKKAGSYASGLDRTQEGYHYLHRDEQVINRARADQAQQGGGVRAMARMVGSGGKVTIEIDPTSMSQAMAGLAGRGFTFGATS